jgi:hypothetical protein
MALAQGSGELIWWPYIIAKYGLAFLFLLIPACLLQFPLTFEIGRYTVLTGEGVFTGFFRLNKTFGLILYVMFTISFLWFGAFASAGGTAIAALTDFPRGWTHENQTMFWAQGSIILFTLALLYVKTAYQLIEWVMKVVAIVSLLGMLIACAHPDVRAVLGEFAAGLVSPDRVAMQTFDRAADAEKLLTAITFAGLGGFWTLFYSYWIKEKRVGMAAHTPRMTGFRDNKNPVHAADGALPENTPDAAPNLRAWYRYLSIETLVGILGNLATTLMMCLLAFAILRPQGLVPEGYQIAVVQAEFFASSWGNAGRLLFLFIAGAFLADTWLATVDCVARIHLDALGALSARFKRQDQRVWYYRIVIALAVITSVTMFFESPGPLILISAVIGFAGAVTYSTALIFLNHRHLKNQLPKDQRSGALSLTAITFVTICYFALATAYLYIKFTSP